MNPIITAVGAVCDRCGNVFRCRSTPPSCLCNPCWLGGLGGLSKTATADRRKTRPITRTATRGRL